MFALYKSGAPGRGIWCILAVLWFATRFKSLHIPMFAFYLGICNWVASMVSSWPYCRQGSRSPQSRGGSSLDLAPQWPIERKLPKCLSDWVADHEQIHPVVYLCPPGFSVFLFPLFAFFIGFNALAALIPLLHPVICCDTLTPARVSWAFASSSSCAVFDPPPPPTNQPHILLWSRWIEYIRSSLYSKKTY